MANHLSAGWAPVIMALFCIIIPAALITLGALVYQGPLTAVWQFAETIVHMMGVAHG